MPEFVDEVTFDSPAEFLASLSPLTSPLDLTGYIFRGHNDDSFRLVPTSLRPEGKDAFWEVCGMGKPIDDQSEWELGQARAEYTLLRAFYRTADQRGLNVPHSDRVRNRLASTYDLFFGTSPFSTEAWQPKDLLELAGLAQHYGLPTRLLDWSYDPLIATYFASETLNQGDYLSVWALDADTMIYMNDTEKGSRLRIVTPPYHGNPNLSAQSGLFTSWEIILPSLLESFRQLEHGGSVAIDRRSVDELLRLHSTEQSWQFQRSPFRRFRLRSEHASELRQRLERAGYGASRVFPGYPGAAAEVKQRHKRNFDEMKNAGLT
jgi:hypothetical protein